MSTTISEVAAALGVSKAAVSQWLNDRCPADRCPALERAFKGEKTAEQLRPDIRWHRIPDPQWPWHPDGRPCIDVVGPVEQGVQAQEQGGEHASLNAGC